MPSSARVRGPLRPTRAPRMTGRSPDSGSISRAGDASDAHVVAVEDDALFRQLLATELGIHGFNVQVFPDAESLLDSVQVAASADALIIDWKLPGRSGFELFSELRERGVETPVIFLTGHALVENERRALLAGALDFIDKTRGFDILVKRLNLVAKAPPSVRVQRRLQRYGRLMLNPVEDRALWDDTDLDLTVSEYRVVELLASKSPDHATYQEIHDQIRLPSTARTHATASEQRRNVRSAIRRIRLKFRACDPSFAQIRNFAALGYVWVKEDETPPDRTV
jgi:two-component system response regulator ChvI